MLICTFYKEELLGNPKHHIACGKTECVTDCHQHGVPQPIHSYNIPSSLWYNYTIIVLLSAELHWKSYAIHEFYCTKCWKFVTIRPKEYCSQRIYNSRHISQDDQPTATHTRCRAPRSGRVCLFICLPYAVFVTNTDRLYHRYQLCHRLIYLSWYRDGV